MKEDRLTRKQRQQWLCVFDIDNCQDDYARCLQTVRWLEDIESIDNLSKTENMLPCPVYMGFAPRSGILGEAELYAVERLLESNDSSKIRRVDREQQLLDGLEKSQTAPLFYYYFRVHLSSGTDIVDTQYLVLILQAQSKIATRCAVRFMENRNGASWDPTDYYRLSDFLRFVENQYDIFFACTGKDISSLGRLGRRKAGVQSTFFPLLVLNHDTCQDIGRVGTFSYEYNGQGFKDLYQAFSCREELSGVRSWTLMKIGLRMLLGNLDGMKFRKKEQKKELLDFMCCLFNENGGVTPLDLALFALLTTPKECSTLDMDNMMQYLAEVKRLSDAVVQLLENAVYHSQFHTGVFSFRVHKRPDYFVNHYPGYVMPQGEYCVEMLISDCNFENNIVDHFLGSNKASKDLRKAGEKIQLGNFFDWYQDDEIKKLWNDSRTELSALCYGLYTFANAGYEYGSAFRVRSCSDEYEISRKNYFYYTPAEDSRNATPEDKAWIPGTQYAWAVCSKNIRERIEKRHKTVTGFAHSAYTTTCKELAELLSICSNNTVRIQGPQIIASLDKLRLMGDIKSEERKDEITSGWKNWFNDLYKEYVRFLNDVDRLLLIMDTDQFCATTEMATADIEPFCKGFFVSDFFKNHKKKLYFLMINVSEQLSRAFRSAFVGAAMRIKFMNICVYFYPRPKDGQVLPETCISLYDLAREQRMDTRKMNEGQFPRVFPYALFCEAENGNTLFEEEMLRQAERSLTSPDGQGYKVCDTHMRLGNKVHLDSFYEMTLFFENPNYAYFTAFLLLRRLLAEEKFKKATKLLFYGYSSYSRGILWAMIEILQDYLGKNGPDMAFVIYQNDLQLESDQPNSQMYYSIPEWQKDPEKIWGPNETTLVQIVPISSSLTTFDKMLERLNSKWTGGSEKKYVPFAKYTAFWVRDNYREKNKGKNKQECFEQPTKEEEPFWCKANEKYRWIQGKLPDDKVLYLVKTISNWSNPLKCKKCFPEDPVLEYPLVETDPSSTIPTQQLYLEDKNTGTGSDQGSNTSGKGINQKSKNYGRIARLKDNIRYGHIARGKNHFQYYIKTRNYFQQERPEVKKWLDGLRKSELSRNPNAFSECINVIVIPKQSSNVEFGQCVYEYYFGGEAEYIIINTEKEFRSNFKAEYNGLFRRLNALHSEGYSIKFHYVDSSISSGSTFYRASTLIGTSLNEIMPEADDGNLNVFPFEKVFLLISRMSEASKHVYVRTPERDFHAYAELHISSIRTFGDSCVPCKLQREAEAFYKYAATKFISAYWENKSLQRVYQPFDLEKDQDDDGYYRMICTHRANDYISQVRGGAVETYFQEIRKFFQELISAINDPQSSPPIYELLAQGEGKDWIAAGLKVMARPFFSFDYRCRCAVMDLYILLAEYFIRYKNGIGNEFLDAASACLEGSGKDYLLKQGNLTWISEFAGFIEKMFGDRQMELLEFARQNILKGLADLKSNYILRRRTLLAVSNSLAEVLKADPGKRGDVVSFYESYVRSILRVTHSSSDETRSVWLEYLLEHGTEYAFKLQPLNWDSLPKDIRECFQTFWDVLMIENNRTLYQGVTEVHKKIFQKVNTPEKPEVSSISKDEALSEISGLYTEYHMRNIVQFLEFIRPRIVEPEEFFAEQLYQLWNVYRQLEPDGNIDAVKKYDNLRKAFKELVPAEERENGDVIMFERWDNSVTGEVHPRFNMLPYCIIAPDLIPASAKYKDLDLVLRQLAGKEKDWAKKIEHYGFYLLPDAVQDNQYQVLIALNNNYDELAKLDYAKKQHIAQVFIYFTYKMTRIEATRLIRAILMFRHALVEWLEKDFSNNTIVNLSRYKHWANLLSRDKVGDHQGNDFIEGQQYILTMEADITEDEARENINQDFIVDKTEMLQPVTLKKNALYTVYEWFLMCSYVDARISRLYRTGLLAKPIKKHVADNGIEDYYACALQKTWMHPAGDLNSIFFNQLIPGNARKHYLELIMQLAYFVVDGKPDYLDESGKDIKDIFGRIGRLNELLDGYECVHIKLGVREYSYLSEYLAVILMDCFISAIKASEEWFHSTWSSDAFIELSGRPTKEKCEIRINRESCNYYFDYLVIKNKKAPYKKIKSEIGMSQEAISWYLNGLWSFYCGLDSANGAQGDEGVQFKENGSGYITKLPILSHRNGI